jgi:hypothetical protein
MKIQRVLMALTMINFGLLLFLLAQVRPVTALGAAPILRGQALQIVDSQGRIRASIAVLPADPAVKMPDGSTGYPETVLLRMITSKGRPTVKLAATEDGSGLALGGESDPTYASLNARGAKPSLKLVNKDGSEQVMQH